MNGRSSAVSLQWALSLFPMRSNTVALVLMASSDPTKAQFERPTIFHVSPSLEDLPWSEYLPPSPLTHCSFTPLFQS
ncbi:hypothetical protein JAAARDRAFT_31614 [Jaapia argillacea MUCL 33604]|uniref:Uncharacterized protein n=1 Tax=Jaapia argillacea MUCL 33604 TaxID=933084 RepID=A0A067QDG6_9AGAM|nr:hypothetical protein JAAARDRAFT_31614 [Jaapia argillacea MUCL 33604]